MLVNEGYRKCVTFLYVDRLDKDTGELRKEPAATAFFVSVPIGNKGSIAYAVTARHVIDASRPYGHLYIRVNTKNGGFEYLGVQQDTWGSHNSTDVAVTPLILPNRNFDLFDLLVIPLSTLATDKYVIQRKIGCGDDVFFVGLFSEYAGQERNQPIIRFGNISLMPYEKVSVRLNPSSDATTLIDAYLVEARSWGGHSGSPAFIYYPPDRIPGSLKLPIGYRIPGGESVVLGEPTALLGLVCGHYEIKREVDLIGDILGSGTVPINAGMAIVVPAQKIIDTLMQEELVEQRDRILKELD